MSLLAPPARLLALNCLVLGHPCTNIFEVKIATTEPISFLKDAVKEKTHPAFQHVAAYTLTLWCVSEIVDENLGNTLAGINFEERELLSPVDRLLKVFSHPPFKGYLHVVIGYREDGKLRVFFSETIPSH